MYPMKPTEILKPKPESVAYLPTVLWMQIISLLPVKSLHIIRCVCKLFLSIIDDPYFVTSHLRNFPANLHQNRTLTLTFCCSAKYIASTAICEVLEPEPNASTSGWVENLLSTMFVAGSLEGLLLIRQGEIVMLWNPSIKRRRQIPSPSTSISSLRLISFGLGYDESCDDYKVLAIINHTFLDPADCRFLPVIKELESGSGAWVFSVKRGSWKAIGLPDWRVRRGISESVSFKGGLVWIEGVDSGHKYHHRLVWFDFATEKYSYSTTPYPVENNESIKNRLVMFDGGSSIGIRGLDSDSILCVWSMDESTLSWTRLESIAEGALRMGAYRNWEMIWEYWSKGARPRVSLYEVIVNRRHLRRPVDYLGTLIESLHTQYEGVYVESLVLRTSLV